MNSKIYEIVFRETVAYHVCVEAPNRLAAEAWADKYGAKYMNEHISSQIVEERGVEECCEIQGVLADITVSDKGNVRVERIKDKKVRVKNVRCKLCEMLSPRKTSHRHKKGYVCISCWDERLKVTS